MLQVLRDPSIFAVRVDEGAGSARGSVVARGSELAPILEAVRGGSVDALGDLYRRYADLVYGLAYRVTGSREEAEEVMQDLFVGLPRALRNYREQDRFEGWLKRVVVRTALMRIRAVRRKREAPLEEAAQLEGPRHGTYDGDMYGAGHDGGAHAASHAGSGLHPIDRIALQRAIERLPDAYRVVFVLKEIEGYTHGEIADLLGISAGSSATRLSRAWAILRKEAESK